MRIRDLIPAVGRRVRFFLAGRSRHAGNVYHCCIQKSASQWFRLLLGDRLVRRRTGYPLYTPGENFITNDAGVLERLGQIPGGVIVSPFYITCGHFTDHAGESDYRAFYIARDPRDIVVSSYFSLRYSHADRADYVRRQRRELETMSEEEGILKIIREQAGFVSRVMLPWRKSANPGIRFYRYEDVFGPGQISVLEDIFSHCRLPLSPDEIRQLAAKYAFSRISGRSPGAEDRKKHYRKGISGDWRNYFSGKHKRLFKQEAGGLLIELGYEPDLDW